MRPLSVALLFACLAMPVHAASFDCGAARSQVETLICTNPALSALDEQLAQAFAAAVAVVPRVTSLRVEQRD